MSEDFKMGAFAVTLFILMVGGLILSLAGCASTAQPVTSGPVGLCWPHESPQAYAEYQSICGQDGAKCPATTAWRVQLRTLAVQIPPCS